jgi:hypothetical protein
MNRSTHFLAGGIAAVAVASGITLTGSAAYAEDAPSRPCGQPAVPAVFVTVVREPVLQVVAPVTHDEWRWEREVTTHEHEFARLVAAAHSETDWVRPGAVEYQWAHKVIDRAAVDAVPGTEEQGHKETVVLSPAVTVTMFEYVQQQTGRTRWEDAGWNAETDTGDNGKGWTRTGNTREDVTDAVIKEVWVVDQPATPGTPAVSELSHQEYTWSAASPGDGWTGPLGSRETGEPETTTTIGDDVPAGTGWTKTAVREVPAVFDTVWAVEPPDGYTATGASRVKDVTTEQSSETSATAPAGDGWTQVADSRTVVVDQPATEIRIAGRTERVEVSPEQPATAPCLAAAHGGEVLAASASTAGSTSGTTVTTSGPRAHADNHAAAAAEAGATVLPATGNPVSPLLLTTGLGALVAGSVLVGISRRRLAS